MNIVDGKRLWWAGGALAALGAIALFVAFDPDIDLYGSLFERSLPVATQHDAAGASVPSAADAPGRAASEQGPANQRGSSQVTALATAQQQASGLAALLAPVPPPAVDSDGPSFDVVNVEPSGDAVIAGRAAPRAVVELLRNGEPYDRVVADQFGTFSMVPPRLPAGAYELTLRARQPDGREVSSKQSVAVVVEGGNRPPTVALTTPDQPTRVLSKPGGSTPQAIAVDAVDIEPNGILRVSGHARPGATVRLYLNDRLVSSAVAGADGRLIATIKDAAWSSKDRLRLDEVDAASGSVLARAEVPLNVPDEAITTSVATPAAAQATSGTAAVPRTQLAAVPATNLKDTNQKDVKAKDMGMSSARGGAKTITVSRGDSLWHISRRLLGGGTRYAVIYRANREQIRSPDLIYPGQVFVLPAK